MNRQARPCYRSCALAPKEGSSLESCSHLASITVASRWRRQWECPLPTVMREVKPLTLVEAGLVTDVRRGNVRLIAAATDNPVFAPLADLMAVTFGPAGVLRDALAGLDGIERAFIYGSWAARYHQQAGHVPGDIDVLVVGTPGRVALSEALEAAERKLRREVNARVVSPDAWQGDGSFKKTINDRPSVDLLGSTDD